MLASAGHVSAPGQTAKYSLRVHIFRFAPESGLKSDIAPCPVRAAKTGSHQSSFDHQSNLGPRQGDANASGSSGSHGR